MTEPSSHEYRALRDTIRSRGTARLSLLIGGFASWAVVLTMILVWLPNPVAATIPLLILVASFEANRVLHLGVERIGRYLQVFFEEGVAEVSGRSITPPAWERAAMILGPTMPGAGGHPLFLPVFLSATIVNFLAVLLPGPLPIELGAFSVPHLAFIAWILYADRGMRRQRGSELQRFRELRDSDRDDTPPGTCRRDL